MTILYLDIETLPCTDESVVEVKCPGNIKKAESIAAWEESERPNAIKEALRKTSFDGLHGRICVIGAAFDDGEPIAYVADDEATLLRAFFMAVADNCKVDTYDSRIDSAITVVGHNVSGFDLPFIRHRAIIHGIKPPPVLLKAMASKPWGNEIADTMLMWSPDREKRASLDKLCRALGIPGKDGFDGSMVADTWPTDPEKVITYCKDDVERARRLYKRLIFA